MDGESEHPKVWAALRALDDGCQGTAHALSFGGTFPYIEALEVVARVFAGDDTGLAEGKAAATKEARWRWLGFAPETACIVAARGIFEAVAISRPAGVPREALPTRWRVGFPASRADAEFRQWCERPLDAAGLAGAERVAEGREPVPEWRDLPGSASRGEDAEGRRAAVVHALRSLGDDNAGYAACGRAVLQLFNDARVGDEAEIALQDLLHYLRHAAAVLGIDYREIDGDAERAFRDALREESDQ